MPSNKLLQAAAGSAGGEGLYPEDVFSTYLYTPTGNAGLAINNGLDLSGEGGLVWSKCRGVGRSHNLIDTNRGGTKVIKSNSDSQETTNANAITAFNSNGYTLGADTSGDLNYASNTPMCSWSFRKAAGFCDIVTYTGNGTSGRTVAHSLGSVPKMIIVKNISLGGYNWQVYHTSTGNTDYLNLNDADATASFVGAWNNTSPTSTHFTLGNWAQTNDAAGSTYVAYLFGDDAVFGTDADESICKMGSFTLNGSGVADITLGFEPQWLIYKRSDGGNENWQILDSMRGWASRTSGMRELYANASSAEATNNGNQITSTGFKINGGHTANGTYIYMAIRRPMKVPTAGTEVFAMDTLGSTGDGNEPGYRSPFPVDMGLKTATTGNQRQISTRLLQGTELLTESTAAETTSSSKQFDYMNGTDTSTATSAVNMMWMFKRATGFFDVVAYTGTGSNRTIDHNLGVAPEMMIIRARESLSPYISNWVVYHSAISPSDLINFDNASTSAASFQFASTAPTSSVFTLGSAVDVNMSGKDFISYHFATLAGISKVGSYTGTGSAINVDCGFSNGARFILIKRTDSSGDWHVYDSLRGIGGNDPYFFLNDTAAQVTNTDYIDPLSSGFTVTSSAPAGLNASSGNYIFLAIA